MKFESIRTKYTVGSNGITYTVEYFLANGIINAVVNVHGKGSRKEIGRFEKEEFGSIYDAIGLIRKALNEDKP